MFDPKHKKYIKLAVALLITLLGSIFMLIPFIPLGFIFLTGGILLLIRYFPVFDRQFNRIKRRNKDNLIVRTDLKVRKVEERIVRFLIREPAAKGCR